MKLIDDWQAILKKAWSVKFSIAAAILSAAEFTVQLVQPEGVPKGMFAIVAMLVSIGATGARVLAQKEITDAPPK